MCLRGYRAPTLLLKEGRPCLKFSVTTPPPMPPEKSFNSSCPWAGSCLILPHCLLIIYPSASPDSQSSSDASCSLLPQNFCTDRSFRLEYSSPTLHTASCVRSQPLSNNPPWLGEAILLYSSIHVIKVHHQTSKDQDHIIWITLVCQVPSTMPDIQVK